jgi:hypothetical protein
MLPPTCKEMSESYKKLLKAKREFSELFESLKAGNLSDKQLKQNVFEMMRGLENDLKNFREQFENTLISIGEHKVRRSEAKVLKEIFSEITDLNEYNKVSQSLGYAAKYRYTPETDSSRIIVDSSNYVWHLALNGLPIRHVPKSISKLSHLHSLYFENSSITEIEGLDKLNELEYLSFNGCGGIKELKGLSHFKKMKFINLFDTGIDKKKYAKEIEELRQIQGDALGI